MSDRPVLHCFAAKPYQYHNQEWYAAPIIVTLEEAMWFKDNGWHIVGPDPADEEALARWEMLNRG